MREDIEGGNCSSWPTTAAGGFFGTAQTGHILVVTQEAELGAQTGHILDVAQDILE